MAPDTTPAMRRRRTWISTAITLALSASSVAPFSPSLLGQHAIRSTQRHAVRDIDTLLRESAAKQQWGRHLSDIETMYNLSSPDAFDEVNDHDNAVIESKVLSKSTTQRDAVRQRTYSENYISEEELVQSSPGKPSFKRVALHRHSIHPPRIVPDRQPSTKSRSSTMPGFVASPRETAFEDGIFMAESRSGNSFAAHFSEKARQKRKQTHGEAMYRTSAAVPDSMMHFANQIHKEDRITPTEECELGKLTQEAIRLQNLYDKLQTKLGREPKDEEWCAAAGKINLGAIQQAMDQGLEAKNKLVTANLRMVQYVVNTYIRNGLGGQYNAGDMMQEGIMALIRAAEKFEPQRGFRFSTYAMYWIRAAVKRSQTVQSRVIPIPQRLHANYKRIMKTEIELRLTLGRAPTKIELSTAVDMSVAQIERCKNAMDQRIYSLDQTLTNSLKPNNGDHSSDTMYDIIASKTDDGEHRTLERVFLREDLIETLNRHLTQTEVQLLMLRFGMVDQEQLPPGYEGSLTIAEVSKLVGLKPDKVRRMIINSLQQMKFVIGEEWDDYEQQLQ